MADMKVKVIRNRQNGRLHVQSDRKPTPKGWADQGWATIDAALVNPTKEEEGDEGDQGGAAQQRGGFRFPGILGGGGL